MATQFKGDYRPHHSKSSAQLQQQEAERSAAPSSADGTPKDYKSMFDGRSALSKFVDPCEDARKESMKCLDVNNYNRDACTEFFRSYRECKKKWLNQRREDRRAGLDV